MTKTVTMDTTAGTARQNVRRALKAVGSDLSLHGITYLGVLVVFGSLLGLLLFSFAEIPDSQQPFYELAMAVVFFICGWYLRRQGAVQAGKAMELIGGMALPLVAFAGYVDGAPIPPNFEGTTLIVVMTVTALALSGVYSWWASRKPDSVLGYLVAPLWWLAALVVGFFFKTNEPLSGDAITRLTTEQPALAALAIAISLLVARNRTQVRTPAIFGAAGAHLLTLILAQNQNWEPTAALLVSGAATLVSIEVLALGTTAATRLEAVRPLLVGGVVAPLFPATERHLLGLAIFVLYLGLYEWSSRRGQTTTPLVWARLGMVYGAIASLGAGWTSLVVFSLATAWGVYRLSRDPSDGEFELIAALAPVGVAYGLIQMMSRPDAYLAVAVVIVSVALLTRTVEHRLAKFWPVVASILLSLHIIDHLTSPLPLQGTASLVMAGLVVGLSKLGWTPRLWLSAPILTAALGSQFAHFENPDEVGAISLGATGAVLVAMSVWSRASESVHVSYFGHLLTLGAGLLGGPGWAALAFGLLALRSGVSAHYSENRPRLVHHTVSVVSAAVSWMLVLNFLNVTESLAYDVTGLTWGIASLLVAGAARIELIEEDWLWFWGGISTLLTAIAVMGAADSSASDIRIGLAIGVAALAGAIEVSWKQTHTLARIATAPLLAAAWFLGLSTVVLRSEIAAIATTIFATVGFLVASELERWQRSHPAVLASRVATSSVLILWMWMLAIVAGNVPLGWTVSGALAVCGIGLGRLARPLEMPWLRSAASVMWVGALLNLAWVTGLDSSQMVIVASVVGALSLAAYLALWHRDPETNWAGPLQTLTVLADATALILAVAMFDRPEISIAVSLSIATQAVAAGTILNRPSLLLVAPPAAALALIRAIAEGVDRNPLWWTIPVGIAGLAEVDILRAVRKHRGQSADSTASLALEVVSAAVTVLPPLVAIFTDGLVLAGVALILAFVGLVWGVLTRLSRRVYAAAGVALSTTVLTLAAAAADAAPESVGFWVTGAGIGIAVLMIAGLVESYRRKSGHVLEQVDRLMAGWWTDA